MRHITFLNGKGDVEVTWDAENDEQMLQVIEAKMKAGVRFFTMVPVKGTFQRKKKQVKKIEQLSGRTVSFDDPDLEAMFSSGRLQIERAGAERIECEAPIKVAAEVIASKKPVVAVRPFVGG